MILWLLVLTYLSVCGAAQSTDVLVRVQDWLDIKSTTDGKIIDHFDLWAFSQSNHYKKNQTVTGKLCYADTVEQFESLCEKSHPSDSWIVLTMFDPVATNNLMNEIGTKKKIVSGIVIGSLTQIESTVSYANPRVIAIISKQAFEELMLYSIPFVLSSSNGFDVQATMTHQYDSSCGTLDIVEYYSYLISLFYFVIVGVWYTLTWYIFGQWSDNNRALGSSRNILQKALITIPVFNLAKTLIYAQYSGACPWNDQLVARYMMMALATVSTIYQTVHVAIILLISKGWTLMRSTLNRQEAMHIMMLLGAVYLSYSSYFVSFGLENIKNLIGASINLLYLVLFVIILKNSFHMLAILKQHQQLLGDNGQQAPSALHDTIRLKISMIRSFVMIMMLNFCFEVFFHGVVPLLMLAFDKPSLFDTYVSIAHQWYELSVNLSLLCVFRPRDWPDYFNLSILEGEDNLLQQQPNQEYEPPKLAPITVAQVKTSPQSSFDMSNLSAYINGDMPVVIVNPYASSDDGAINRSSDSLRDFKRLGRLMLGYKDKRI